MTKAKPDDDEKLGADERAEYNICRWPGLGLDLGQATRVITTNLFARTLVGIWLLCAMCKCVCRAVPIRTCLRRQRRRRRRYRWGPLLARWIVAVVPGLGEPEGAGETSWEAVRQGMEEEDEEEKEER
jgi:hypothetical protein